MLILFQINNIIKLIYLLMLILLQISIILQINN